jgi:hypothetical protein
MLRTVSNEDPEVIRQATAAYLGTKAELGVIRTAPAYPHTSLGG